jgi:hypothetical protein
MNLNDYRDEADEFVRMIGATDEPVDKILGWLDNELALLRKSLNDRPQLAHQIYDMLFLLFELAARHNLDIDEQWAQGRRRKRGKYGPTQR